MISEYLEKARSGNIDISTYAEKAIVSSEKINHDLHFFNVICREEAMQQAQELSKKKDKGRLHGLIISVKDNICVKGVESTATSKMLKGYKPLFDATAIARLRDEGAIIIGKTSCDEFGFGSFNRNTGVDYPVPKNPLDPERATGGSSGGAGGITRKADFEHVAIAESTGGSIESPAAFCGVVGFCPTYGRVSRYGLISYANSLDKIGVMSKNVSDIAPVLDVMAGHDGLDATSLKERLDLKPKRKIERIGLIKESMSEGVDPKIKDLIRSALKRLESRGIAVEEVSMPLTFKYGIPVYYIIATCEASTNLSCLSGLRYGMEGEMRQKSFNEYFSEVRSANFGEEAKRRIMLGTFARMAGFRDAYYIKATKARTLMIEEYNKLLSRYDILVSPTMPVTAPRFSDIAKMTPLENYMMDVLTVGPNLAGVPHASIPVGDVSGLPAGLMASAGHMKEAELLEFLKLVEGSR